MGHRMAVSDPAREERARRARALGCDASKGQHIEAQGEFHLRRRIQILEEQLAAVEDQLFEERVQHAWSRALIAALEPIGATAEPGW